MSGPLPDFKSYCEAACIKLWGEPDRRTPKMLRWNGDSAYSARVFNIPKRVWYDHGQERGGSTLELVDYVNFREKRELRGAIFIEVWREAHAMGIVPDPPPPKENGGTKWPIRATFPYEDEQGVLLFEVVRFDTEEPDDRFRQRRPDGSGGWIWDLKGLRRVLYRLRELIDAIARGEEPLVCEGEADAEAARKLGYAATTMPGGVGKWREEYDEFFRFANVVVISDNDPQLRDEKTGELKFHPNGRPVLPGQDHAADVAQRLARVADSVRVVMFPQKDLREWIKAGGTREQLDALIAQAPVIQDGTAPEQEAPPPPPSDELITEQLVMLDFIAAYKDKLRYNHDSQFWLIWQEHYWKNDGKRRAFAWVLEMCRELECKYSMAKKKGVKSMVQKVRFASAVEQAARAQEEVATQTDEWDHDPYLLGTPQGVVDLRTGELRGGRPDDMISKITAASPAEIADCPHWDEFVDYALAGKRENVDFLQRYGGYCLTGVTMEEFLLYLVGPPGTGKGTFTKTFAGALGNYAKSVPITMFTDASWHQEYYRATLAGYRVILASEPEKDSAWSEGFVNEVTGSDRLSGRHPAGRPFEFDPTHKLLLQGPVVPDLKGVASGLRRRLGLLKWERPPLVPDTKLKDTLRGEYPGILRWLITGCLAWQKDGLNPPDDVRAASARYFENQDVFRRWAEERCIINPQGREKPSVLRLDYNAWAQRNGERTMSFSAFHDAVANFHNHTVVQVTIKGTGWVKGLTLKPNSEDRWEREQL